MDSKDLQDSSPQKEPVKERPVYYDTLVLSGASSRAFLTLGAIQ